jgi:hypothetical protein
MQCTRINVFTAGDPKISQFSNEDGSGRPREGYYQDALRLASFLQESRNAPLHGKCFSRSGARHNSDELAISARDGERRFSEVLIPGHSTSSFDDSTRDVPSNLTTESFETGTLRHVGLRIQQILWSGRPLLPGACVCRKCAAEGSCILLYPFLNVN